VAAVSGGDTHSVALLNNGTVWTWGLNDEGQLGIGSSSGPENCKPQSRYPAAGCSTKPVQVVGPGGTGHLSNITAVAGGPDFTLALRSDGTVWAWGSDAWTTLGQSNPALLEQCQTPFAPIPVFCSTKPLQVVGPRGQGFLTGVKAVAAEGSGGALHAMALKSDGTVWTWGIDDEGQLGNGKSEEFEAAPVQVLGPGGTGNLTRVAAVAVGGKFSVALKTDGTVWAWGFNIWGQLGINDKTGPELCTIDKNPCSTKPVQVHGLNGKGLLAGIAAVAAGDAHLLAAARR
jgi:alpha-tubulin suppressor-like RCC1 family protein